MKKNVLASLEGPWTVGKVIDDHIGAIFIWGIYVANSYLPGGFTYLYGFLHLVMFNLPLTILLALQADHRYVHSSNLFVCSCES